MKWAYYNEIDPYAAQWLRNLIAAGHIADGFVDERSITDVRPDDLFEFNQCHFFAGIGVWSHALRRAGWPDDRPVWTGSCPCQPFSTAGKQAGVEDERHLWPIWNALIQERRPPVIFGEQVAAAIGHSWLDTLQANLEEQDYAVGAAVLGAHSVGAPHIRQRLYFVANNNNKGLEGRGGVPERSHQFLAREGGVGSGMADANGRRQQERGQQLGYSEQPGKQTSRGNDDGGRCGDGRMADSGLHGSSQGRGDDGEVRSISQGERQPEYGSSVLGGGSAGSRLADPDLPVEDGGSPIWQQQVRQFRATGGYWSNADWLYCRDGKIRPVEPGTFPLAHGAPSRMGRLRAYGNAICAETAKEFIAAYMSCQP